MHATHQSVHGSVGLIVQATTFGLSVFHGGIDDAGVTRLSGGSQDQRGISSSILEYRLVSVENICILRSHHYLGLVNVDGYIVEVIERIDRSEHRTYIRNLRNRRRRRCQFV